MRSIILVLCAALSFSAFAGTEDVKQSIIAGIKTHLNEVVRAEEIYPTPIEGLWEIRLGPKVYYTDPNGSHMISGYMVDLASRRNITRERNEQARATVLDQIPTEAFVEYAAPDQVDVLYVYTDLTCPYCEMLHAEIPKLNAAGITVRYLLWPREGVSSEGYRVAKAALCAENPRLAINAAFKGFGAPSKVADCQNEFVDKTFRIGNAMGVRATPTMYWSSGQEIHGFRDASEIVKSKPPQ